MTITIPLSLNEIYAEIHKPCVLKPITQLTVQVQ